MDLKIAHDFLTIVPASSTTNHHPFHQTLIGANGPTNLSNAIEKPSLKSMK